MRVRSLSAAGVFALLATAAGSAAATPSVEPKCSFGGVTIQDPPGGAGVMFDDACTTAYVMPPENGEARVAAIAQNANLQFCPAVLRAHEAVDATMDVAATMIERIKDMIEGFDPLRKDLEALRAKVNRLQMEKEVAEETLEAATDRKDDLTQEVADARADHDTCVSVNGADACAQTQAALQEARDALRDHITAAYTPARSAASKANAAHKRAFNDYTGKTKKLAEALDPLFDLQNRVFDIQNQVLTSVGKFSALEGATGQLVYSIQWDRLIRDYQAANPFIPVTQWTPVPLQSAEITATTVINDNPTSAPALLWSVLPGAGRVGPGAMPDGGQVPPASTSPSGTDLGQSVMPFGSSVSAQMALSLNGACPFFPAGLVSPSEVRDIDFRSLTAHVVPNVHYAYEVKAKRSYTARYNLSMWLTRVEQKVKRGGFFSSKVLHDIVDDGSSSDWFEIAFDVQAGHDYTQAEKDLITKEVKGQLTERALEQVALQNELLSPPPPHLSGLSPTGTGTAAAYLSQGCGFFSWCYFGGFMLGTLDSIFGRQEAVQNFRRNHSVWVTDRVEDAVILQRSGTLTFATPEGG